MTEERNQDETVAPRRRGRRQFMVGGAAAGAGLAAGLIADAEPAAAASGHAVQLGQVNTAAATTAVVLTSGGSALAGRTAVNGNVGVEGTDTSPGGGYGVFGVSPKGYAVYGISTGHYGVYGTSSSGTGVYGNSDTGYGLHGDTGSSAGVFGNADGVEGRGVSGGSSGKFGSGLLGTARGPSGGCTGASGANLFDPGGYGVYAFGQKGTGLYVQGTAHVTGALSKGGGSFQIDHPLDPAHKYLYHSFVESPDMKNVYDGTVTLDSSGRATVELPEWFETLNRDFRYQLTAIGAAAPDLHVAAKVADGTFAIAGGKPGLEVSWQVTGIRQDAWANAHRIPVEADKPAAERGATCTPTCSKTVRANPSRRSGSACAMPSEPGRRARDQHRPHRASDPSSRDRGLPRASSAVVRASQTRQERRCSRR